MSAPVSVWECRHCGYLAYPARILCPRCGGGEWERRPAGSGVVTEVTVRRPVFERRGPRGGDWLDQEPTRLAAVRSDLGVRVVARVPEGVGVGDRVALLYRGAIAVAVPSARVV